MNPETNRFESLSLGSFEKELSELGRLVRPNGQPIPNHWVRFVLGELIVIKEYTFKVGYIGESAILFEPVGPVLVSGEGGSPK